MDRFELIVRKRGVDKWRKHQVVKELIPRGEVLV